MRDQGRPAEMQRLAALAAREDRLGADEIPGQRQRQRLVILAVGCQRLVGGHRVEAGLGGGEIVASGLDPAGDEPGEQRVGVGSGASRHRLGAAEIALGKRAGKLDEHADRAAGDRRHQPVGEHGGRVDVAERHAGERRVLGDGEVLGIARQRLAEVARGLGVVVADVGLHAGEVGTRQGRGRRWPRTCGREGHRGEQGGGDGTWHVGPLRGVGFGRRAYAATAAVAIAEGRRGLPAAGRRRPAPAREIPGA
jgi:hypothetical protein